MYTRCPTCSTCFRVTDRHLAIAKGKVRCGQCQLVFNATEHAIDDLPANLTGNKPVAPVTPAPKTRVTKPLTPPPTKKVTPAPMAATAKEKIATNVQPAKVTKPKKPAAKKSIVKTPVFDSAATMIADISTLDKNEIETVNLDIPPVSQSTINKDYDDMFDDSFDINAAIDELTQATKDKLDEITIEKEKPVPVKEKTNLPKNNAEDVFKTDAYDATSAASVSDIMSEMEGQLSLDIAEPNNDNNADYDADNEFDFLKLNSESDNKLESKNNKKNGVDEFELLLGIDDEEPDNLNNNFLQEEHFDIEADDNEVKNEDTNKEDELFNQVDLSDFEDNNVEDSIILEESPFENSEFKNIGQHADDHDVPIQLRNDLKHLHTSLRRKWHPLLTSLFLVVLLIFLFSQLAFFRAHDLVQQIPATRPLLEAFCETAGCFYSGPRDIKQIELLSRDVRLHPKEKKALLISAAIINNAYFDQPYPDIHIRLSDISGNVVAERIFNAKTYMGKLSNPFLLMKSKTPVHINFEVVDPGKDAVNFEFTFL